MVMERGDLKNWKKLGIKSGRVLLYGMAEGDLINLA